MTTQPTALPSRPEDLAPLIDHTLLQPGAGEADLRRYCEEALQHLFCSVCINPVNVPLVAQLLRGSAVKTCSVVGFPLGATTSWDKAAETANAVHHGADEIDMVINIGALRDGRPEAVRDDIAAVRKACEGRVLKVIIETCLLTDEQKRIACRLAAEAKADFVKTSTGFSTGGATVEDVRLMRGTVGNALGVKASGGIRDWDTALAMIAAGANRIGASSGVALVTGAPASGTGY